MFESAAEIGKPLPPQAEAFLARVSALPVGAWSEILRKAHRPLRIELGDLLRGLLLGITPRRFKRHFVSNYSLAAEARLQQLAEAGALPVHLGWRVIKVTGSALQALCVQGALSQDQIRNLYMPFDEAVPFASLREPLQPTNHSVGA